MKSNSLRVIFILEQAEILSSYNDSNGVNPGVGGTSYTTIRTILALQRSRTKLNNRLKLYLGLNESSMKEFHGIPIENLHEKANLNTWDVAILTGGSLDRLHSGEIEINAKRLLAWIRHPYDWDKIQKAKSINAEILSVGKAQYISNALITGRHHHIDNLFCSENIQKAAGWQAQNQIPIKSKEGSEIFRIGFMGALVHSKGFHQFAKYWSTTKENLARSNKVAELHVIGGSGLYNFREEHKYLPCDSKYGDILMKILGDEISKSVIFHGTMGKERYRLMSDCDIAVVNPSGNGEAFPATILEWLALGIPVISSLGYGCADTMQYLPNLTIRSSKQIPQKIAEIALLDPYDKENLRNYCIRISSLFSSNQLAIINQWYYLLDEKPGDIYINEYLHPRIYLLLLIQWIKMAKSQVRVELKRLFLPRVRIR